MTCIRVGNAIICGIPDNFISLEPFGAKVWCEMHSYFGPTFYRSENAITPIQTPSRKTWKAYEKWKISLAATDPTSTPTDI